MKTCAVSSVKNLKVAELESYRMRTILITGVTGFIGRKLSDRLSANGLHVIGAGRHLVDGSWDSFIQMDLASHEHSFELDGVGTIFHLASKAHALSERQGDDSDYYDVIVGGTRSLVEAALESGVKRFVYISSVKAMGEGVSVSSVDEPIDESLTPQPVTPYGKAKLEAEKIVLGSGIEHVSVLRPVMVYGSGHKGNLVRMAEAIRARRFPPIKECGNRRSMVHVDDLVDACIAGAFTPKANREVFIVSGNRAPSTRELYDDLRREMGLSANNWSLSPYLLKVGALAGDFLGKVLGVRMPLDSDTFHKLTQSAWYSNDKSRILLGLDYRHENLPYL